MNKEEIKEIRRTHEIDIDSREQRIESLLEERARLNAILEEVEEKLIEIEKENK